MRQVKKERTGWRDKELSERHRDWGYNCPTVDLDFVVVEYNHGKPVAIVEYKHYKALRQNLDHPTYRALCALANGYKEGPLPCLIARYWPDCWAFKITPLNHAAQAHYKHLKDNEILTECRFVRSLYLLRKDVLSKEDESDIKKLNNEIPPNDTTITPTPPSLDTAHAKEI